VNKTLRDTATMKHRLTSASRRRMHLPESYWAVDLREVPESVRPHVERYVRKLDHLLHEGVGLLIVGPEGVGKTAIASLLIQEARSRTYTTLFVQPWQMRQMLEDRTPFEEGTSMMERAMNVELLVIDGVSEEEVGARYFDLKRICGLVRHRVSWKLPTIITSRVRRAAAEIGSGPLASLGEVCRGALVPLLVDGPNRHEKSETDIAAKVFED
jgi:DNA replication protein DnaC